MLEQALRRNRTREKSFSYPSKTPGDVDDNDEKGEMERYLRGLRTQTAAAAKADGLRGDGSEEEEEKHLRRMNK
jgi:hypothetical protein